MFPVGLILALVLALAPWLLDGAAAWAFWPMRGVAALALALAAPALNRRRVMPLVASPLYLLPLTVFLFYSLLPALFAAVVLGPPVPLPAEGLPIDLRMQPTGISYEGYTLMAVASRGEAVVLSFVGLAVAFAVLLDRHPLPKPAYPAFPAPAWPLALILGAGAAFKAAKAVPAGLPPLALSVADTLPALVLLGVAVLAQHAAWRGGRAWLPALLGLVLAVPLLSPHATKLAIMFAGAFLVLLLLNVRGAVRVAALALLLAAPVLGAVLVGVARNTHDRADFGVAAIARTFVWKAIYRQSETVYCLNFVLREGVDRADSPWRTTPFYFLSGLVPRALWPDKPSLSLGAIYARDFCGSVPLDSPVEGFVTSGSITLAGEPLLRGGAAGLALFGTTMLGIAAALRRAWLGGGLAPAVALALVPWLLDFDQYFALYVANAARALLALAAGAWILSRLRRA